MIIRAHDHHLMVIISLWDFYIYEKHPDLVTNETKTDSYIRKALVPMMAALEMKVNLIAWEVMNEPEWVLEKGISVTQIQKFVAKIADAVHQYSKKYVTVGSASLKWNSDIRPAVANYWKDSALQAVLPHSKAYLDFYQIHYYD